ncbi:MAG: hypothetical protein IPM95_00005 [Sphingobacteriales bacterium]|nr:hypothetical protein [Sphingobacteriales bacterium]
MKTNEQSLQQYLQERYNKTSIGGYENIILRYTIYEKRQKQQAIQTFYNTLDITKITASTQKFTEQFIAIQNLLSVFSSHRKAKKTTLPSSIYKTKSIEAYK